MAEQMHKALTAKLETGSDPRRFTATITTNAVDRDGEVLIPAGMIATEFESNPVVFYNHDYNRPIAQQMGKFKRTDAGIEATAEFAPRPADHVGPWFPDEIKGLVQCGVVKGVSVGFYDVDGGTRTATKADREKFGPEVRRVFSMWKLVEWSIAPLPANPTALISAAHKGLITPEGAKAFWNVDVPDAEPEPTPEPEPKPRKTQVSVISLPMPRRATRPVHILGVVMPSPRRSVTVDKLARRAVLKAMGRLYEPADD